MEDSTIQESYQEIKTKAKEYYSGIGRVWCPAVKGYVVFNGDGFRHLIWKGGTPRHNSEQKRRLALLPYARGILENPSAVAVDERDEILHSTKINGKRILAVSTAHFWRITHRDKGKVIKLIVRQVNGNEKHFFSIFEEKQKTIQS